MSKIPVPVVSLCRHIARLLSGDIRSIHSTQAGGPVNLEMVKG
jgi:hypothetical protein